MNDTLTYEMLKKTYDDCMAQGYKAMPEIYHIADKAIAMVFERDRRITELEEKLRHMNRIYCEQCGRMLSGQTRCAYCEG